MRRKRRKAWLYFLIGYVYTFIKFIDDKSVLGIGQTIKLTMTMVVILFEDCDDSDGDNDGDERFF